jgi:hypothetical protein
MQSNIGETASLRGTGDDERRLLPRVSRVKTIVREPLSAVEENAHRV